MGEEAGLPRAAPRHQRVRDEHHRELLQPPPLPSLLPSPPPPTHVDGLDDHFGEEAGGVLEEGRRDGRLRHIRVDHKGGHRLGQGRNAQRREQSWRNVAG